VGTLAHIQQPEAGPGGAIAMLMAHRRVLIKEAVNIKTPPLIVRVQHLAQASLEAANTDEVKATSNEILATLRDIIKSNPLFQQHVSYFARRIDVSNPYALADFAASLTTADAKELQDVLETMDLGDRLRKALLLLKKEQQLSLLQASIKQDVEKRIDKQQRTWFLMEQLKSIKKELGLEKDDKVRRGGRARRELREWRPLPPLTPSILSAPPLFSSSGRPGDQVPGARGGAEDAGVGQASV
jgi:Lon-like ATP-dependent protease